MIESIIGKIERTDWQKIGVDLHEKGYAIVPKFLAHNQCQRLIELYDNPNGYRKTVKS